MSELVGDARYGITPVIDTFEDFVPVPGRSIVYKIADGQYRPAQIVQVWPDGKCNIVVFLDGSNDERFGYDGELIAWKTSRTCGTEIDQWLPRVPVDLDG